MPGYRIFGQGNAICMANGKWSRVHGKCSSKLKKELKIRMKTWEEIKLTCLNDILEISCGKPKILPGVVVYGRSYLYQEQLSYNCPNGGPKGSITCQSNGKWTDPPVCNTTRWTILL